MAEFYVTYDRQGKHCLGIVSASEQPETLQFGSYDEFENAMDALGNAWQFHGEIIDPQEHDAVDAAAWLKRIAEAKAMTPEPKPEIYLFGGSGDSGAYPSGGPPV